MRVLFVHPSFSYSERHLELVQPTMAPVLGANVLAEHIRNAGHEARVFDPLWHVLDRDGSREDFEAHVAREARTFAPDLVCVSVLSHLRTQAEGIGRRIRETLEEPAAIAVGGVHVTDGRDVAIAQFREMADVVAAGPGESTVLRLLETGADRAQWSAIPGVLWTRWAQREVGAVGTASRGSGQLPPPDEVPLPNYDQYASRLDGGVLQRVFFVTSRGCPYSCRFCSAASVAGRPWAMSPTTVTRHLCHLQWRYGVRELSFHDESFFFDRARAIAIFEGIERWLEPLEDVYVHTTVASLERDVLCAYRRAGGRKLFVGIESGSERIRTEMRKPFSHRMTNEEILARGRLCREEGVEIGAFIIVGWPGESERDREETLHLLEALQPADVQTSILKLYPGTEVYERAKREGKVSDQDWLDCTRPYFTYLTGGELDEARAFGCLLEARFQTYAIRRPFESQGDRYLDQLTAGSGVPPKAVAFAREAAATGAGTCAT